MTAATIGETGAASAEPNRAHCGGGGLPLAA